MYKFTTEEFDTLRKEYFYRITNRAWNESGVNHPDNVGYLMSHIGDLHPRTYEEWEEYFYKNIADHNKLMEYTERFRDFVFADTFIMKKYNYHHLHFDVFYKMVVCRLIYETWQGYFAEVETGRILVKKLKDDGFQVKVDKLSPKDDNKYAVDFFLYSEEQLICGIQVKSENYHKSNQQIVQDTIKMNSKKNERFSEEYGVPVLYAFYKRINSTTCVLADDDVVEDVERLLNS